VPAARLAELRDAVDGRVTDPALRVALGLDETDVITHVAGHPFSRAWDPSVIGDATFVYVELVRDGEPRVMRWELAGERPRPPAPIDPLVASVEKLDELRYAVPRSTIERVLANPTEYAASARVVAGGLALHDVRPDSLIAALGFRSGDTVRAINGHALAGIDMLDIYLKIRDARELAIDITRRGTYELITIVIK
jgi:hypothetical protein